MECTKEHQLNRTPKQHVLWRPNVVPPATNTITNNDSVYHCNYNNNKTTRATTMTTTIMTNYNYIQALVEVDIVCTTLPPKIQAFIHRILLHQDILGPLRHCLKSGKCLLLAYWNDARYGGPSSYMHLLSIMSFVCSDVFAIHSFISSDGNLT